MRSERPAQSGAARRRARLPGRADPSDGAFRAPSWRGDVDRLAFYGCRIPRYSKSRIDRAGQTLAEYLVAPTAGETDRLRGVPVEDVVEAWDVVEWWRGEHARPLSRVAANLRYYAAEHGRPVVGQRLKKMPTIADKLLREPRMKLSRMGDIGGARAVLPNQDAVYAVAARLRRNWTITRERDYVADPKVDGYRAVHLHNRHRGRLIEVQLRTPGQDAWANAVEADARHFDLRLKAGGGPSELREFYVAAADLVATLDAGGAQDPALAERLKRLRERAATFRDRRTR